MVYIVYHLHVYVGFMEFHDESGLLKSQQLLISYVIWKSCTVFNGDSLMRCWAWGWLVMLYIRSYLIMLLQLQTCEGCLGIWHVLSV